MPHRERAREEVVAPAKQEGWSRACPRLTRRRWIEAFESYRNRQVNGQYIDEPVKPQPCDHPMDALRYYFVNCRGPYRAETRRIGYS